MGYVPLMLLKEFQGECLMMHLLR